MKYKGEVLVSNKDKNSERSKIIFSLNVDDMSTIKSYIGINERAFRRARFHAFNVLLIR